MEPRKVQGIRGIKETPLGGEKVGVVGGPFFYIYLVSWIRTGLKGSMYVTNRVPVRVLKRFG